MIAKLVAWAGTRDEAIARMTRALDEYEVLGIKTTIPFFLWLMRAARLSAPGASTPRISIGCSRRGAASRSASCSAADEELVAIAAALDAFLRAERGRRGSRRVAAGSALAAGGAPQEALRG